MADALATRPRTLKELRKAANMSQSAVAELMGVNRQRVGHIEAKYPAIRYDVLVRYVQALGGHVRLTVGGLEVDIDEIGADPNVATTRDYLLTNASRAGVERMKGEASAAEELVLQGEQTDTGGDDTGRQIDHADAECHQGDSGQGEQS